MKALAAALVEAQKKMPVVHKTAKANYGNYATLDQLIEKTKPVLIANGLAIAQFPTETSTGGPGLRTILMHNESGDSIESTVPLLLNGKNDMQTLGGAITYARRYGWAAVLGIANDEDDDGNAVSAPGTGASKDSGATAGTGSAAGSGTVVGGGTPAVPQNTSYAGQAASDKQKSFIKRLLGDNGFTVEDLGVPLENLTRADASAFIEQLRGGTFNPASLAAAGGGFLADEDIPFAATIDGLGN